MIINIDDNHLQKFAAQVQTELSGYRDEVPDVASLAQAIEILISERVGHLTTDPKEWFVDFHTMHNLEMAAWEQQRFAEREARKVA